ncbi:DedA family protein [Tropicimonas sp. IMCC34043]|uniref:DedA family protein n=1 Tax=Tropicimonas sp. IMCC34043 TaxID=2248760 RepID=UPI000E28288F|nr:VTT domain-containing protein [Tropicimonas sp. IMCC34043]
MIVSGDALHHLVQGYGLFLLMPLAILEGPIVTVIAGWACRSGDLPLFSTFVVLIIADLIGDGLLYALGRWGLGRLPRRWKNRLHLSDRHLSTVGDHFAAQGGRTLVGAKLTHTFGLPVLVAAGAARMPGVAFMGFNLIATIPKTAAFLALGYLAGQAQTTIETWIGRGSFAVLLLGVGLVAFWLRRRHKDGAA